MERTPRAGLIQTTPAIINAETLYQRVQQFGVRLYGRVAATGLAWWTGPESAYFGHNAIVRVRAFAESCGLPVLPGRKPLGGHVMSHDSVEAAYLRRQGWSVCPEAAEAEWAAFQGFRLSAACRTYYRRRETNTERKAGNVADWVRRFGGAYPHMVILDADSLMSGETLLHLVDAMERQPDIGLIQTTPTVINAESLFARAQQFGVRLYGRVASAGLAWWSGSEASYWGHNAIVRVRAFAQCAGLPHLPGRKPFGGHVMSHDVVEAGLLRRGGWGVVGLFGRTAAAGGGGRPGLAGLPRRFRLRRGGFRPGAVRRLGESRYVGDAVADAQGDSQRTQPTDVPRALHGVVPSRDSQPG
jgi:membrane glycosyltransferase